MPFFFSFFREKFSKSFFLRFLLDLPHTPLSRLTDKADANMITVSARDADIESLKRVLSCNKWKKHEIDQALALPNFPDYHNKRDLLMAYRETGRIQSHA